MNLHRRDFSAALVGTVLGGLTLSAAGTAAAQSNLLIEGVQYTRVQPAVPTQSGGKIEVIDFFSFACLHCSAFEPTLQAWVNALPEDVVFRRVPVPFLTNAQGYQRMYYALEAMGLVDAMQRQVFTAVHMGRQRLDTPANMADLLVKNGIDAEKFLDVYNSFSVGASVAKATRLVSDYRIADVPALAIQGKFLTSPWQAGSIAKALGVADSLIAQTRRG